MTEVDAVVVGSGISGLTAARLLAHEGLRVVVLEARDRIGGRLHSDRSDGHVTDLGASWIHGIDGSPVAAAAEAFGLRTLEFTVGGYQPDGRPMAHYDPTGTRLSDAAAERYVADIHLIDADLLTRIAAAPAGSSYLDVVDAALAEQGWDAERAERVREYMTHRTEEQNGVWIGDMDAHSLDDDAIEGIEVVFPDGYDALPARLAEGLDVRLGHRARGVAWGPEGVRVETDRGAFTARQAVVTVPLGTLKSGAFTFSPALPEVVAGPIGRLAVNAFEKVILRYPERFWDDGVYVIRQQGPEAQWWHSWYDLTALDGTPTLLTFAAGPAARGIRDWPDDRVVESVHAQLRRLYGDRVPEPTGVHITHWQDDPYTHGSYAFMPVGAATSDHDDLATPVGGVLHLAGEATWTDDPATVNGAMLSGHRAACRALGRDVAIEGAWARG